MEEVKNVLVGAVSIAIGVAVGMYAYNKFLA